LKFSRCKLARDERKPKDWEKGNHLQKNTPLKKKLKKLKKTELKTEITTIGSRT